MLPLRLLALASLSFFPFAVPQVPVRVGEGINPPARKKQVRPAYPDEARNAWIQGVVTLDVVVDSKGNVKDITVIRSVPLLDEAAVEAVREWEYEPTVVNGEAIPVVMTVALVFTFPGDDEWVVAPEGEAELELDDYLLKIGRDGSRSYSGTIRNISGKPIQDVVVAVTYVERPVKRKHVQPRYPNNARLQGLVILEFVVDEQGKVQYPRVLRSIPELDPVAVAAVRQWEYEPMRHDGSPAPFVVEAAIGLWANKVTVEERVTASKAASISTLEPGGSREFSISLPAREGGPYRDAALVFRAGNAQFREVPTSRQKKTLSPR